MSSEEHREAFRFGYIEGHRKGELRGRWAAVDPTLVLDFTNDRLTEEADDIFNLMLENQEKRRV